MFLAALCVAFVTTGVVAGMLIEGWKLSTAIYFTVQVITTIGYGDITVTSDHMKFFCAVYVILMLMIAAYIINFIVDAISEKNSKFMTEQLHFIENAVIRLESGGSLDSKQASKVAKKHFKRYDKVLAATASMVLVVLFGTIFFATYEACSCSYGVMRAENCIDDSYQTCAKTGGFVKSWVSCFYMSVITLTTVGFGDHSAQSPLGRWISIPWMLLGVAIMANWVNEVRAFFFESSAVEKHKKDDHHLFHSVKKDHSHGLTLAEYRCYTLLKMHLVTREQLRHIDDHFHELEKQMGGKGHVTYEDLQRHKETV